MRTVEEVFHQMTDAKSIMQDLRATLRTIDPEYPAEEEKYLQASAALKREVGDTVFPSAQAYLEAKEEALAMELLYMGWLGFRLNLDIFYNPVNGLLLKGDFAELHCEHRLGTLDSTKKAREVQAAFIDAMKSQPGDQQELTESITEFYSYLETTGYKIAHYFGYRFADLFLPNVVPGYSSDMVHTRQYQRNLEDYLHMDLEGRVSPCLETCAVQNSAPHIETATIS